MFEWKKLNVHACRANLVHPGVLRELCDAKYQQRHAYAMLARLRGFTVSDVVCFDDHALLRLGYLPVR